MSKTRIDLPRQVCVHTLFETQASHTPDAVAVVCKRDQLTYGELNRRANQLAHFLQGLGVGPEVLVGVCMERSVEMVVSLLAILKAGGAYLPLDPTYPQERLVFMLQDAHTPVLLTKTHLFKRISGAPHSHITKRVCLNSDWQAIAQESEEAPLGGMADDNLIYVLYTSGSTGKPKGVMIEHRHVVALLRGFEQVAPAGERLVGASVCPFGFDVSVWECFSVLCFGGTLHVLAPEVSASAERFSDYLADWQVTSAYIPPALLNGVTDQLEKLRAHVALDRILVGVEPIKQSVLQRFRDLSERIRIVNGYGPTETTICATLFSFDSAMDPERRTPIGTAVPGYQVRLVDSQLEPVPADVPGEILIGGQGLARGYLRRPELTAATFIPSPPQSPPQVGGRPAGQGGTGARLYRTGDLAHYLPDGNIEFLGRSDYQVKVRGFRIELGEIESALSQHPEISAVAVLARQDTLEDKRLVAYFVAWQTLPPTASELRRYMQEKLPDYMMPTAFVHLEAMPLTPNGKIDRRALPAPGRARPEPEETYVAPRTPVEEMLAGMWAQVLGLEPIGIHDDFFELGGHSLLGTQIISRVRDAFQVELSLRTLFEAATIAELAERIEGLWQAGPQTLSAPPLAPRAREGEIPLSFAQKRLWFLDRWEPGIPVYNIPAAYSLEGALDVAALARGLDEIVRRHEALRTTFVTTADRPLQVITPALSPGLSVVDLRELSELDREAQAQRLTLAEARWSFDLAAGPLFRAVLLWLDEERHALLLTMHHIVSDGWSMGVFILELTALYRAFVSGETVSLSELPVQYADFTLWQREWLRGATLEAQLAYWKQQLAGVSDVLDLPADRPRPPAQTFRGAIQRFEVSKPLTEALQDLSRQQGCTLFMTLLAAFKTLLYRYTGQEDIVVGSFIANRNHSEIEGLIGFFVNTLLPRSNLAGNPTFRELTRRVREVTLGAYAHQDLPFERLVEELRPERDQSYNPLFQVAFALQNVPMPPLDLVGLRSNALQIDNGTAKFDLVLDLTETPQGLWGHFEYNTDLFEATTIARMVDHLQTLLQGVVTNPQQRLADLPILTEPERVQLLEQWSHTGGDYARDLSINDLFRRQVNVTPAKAAVVGEEEELTFQQLDQQANKLAHFIRRLSQ